MRPPLEASRRSANALRQPCAKANRLAILARRDLLRSTLGGTVQDTWIDGWAASVAPRDLLAGTARLLPKGRNLPGDFHCHPSATAPTDQTRVGI